MAIPSQKTKAILIIIIAMGLCFTATIFYWGFRAGQREASRYFYFEDDSRIPNEQVETFYKN